MITVQLKNDEILREWESITIKQSMGQVQHSVDIKATDFDNVGIDRYSLQGGTFLEIFFSRSDNIFRGFVQKYKEDLTDNSHSISLTAESEAIDLVQCNHVGNYFWSDVTAESIIEEVLEPFDLDLTINEPLLPVPKEGFRVAVDTKAYDIIKKIAEQNGLLVFTDRFGAITIGLDVEQTSTTLLETGDYSKISVEHNLSSIHSTLILKSQQKSRKEGRFKEEQQQEIIIENSNLSRYRPLVAISNGKFDTQKKLADYAYRRINGDGIKVNLTVHSLYDKNNVPWGIGQRVWVREPHLQIDNELIISDATFTQSRSGGTSVNMSLKVPQSFTLKKPSATSVRKSKGFFGLLLGIFV